MSFLEVEEFLVHCGECGAAQSYALPQRTMLWVGELEIFRQRQIREELDQDVASDSLVLVPVLCDACSRPVRADLAANAASIAGVGDQIASVVDRARELEQGVTDDQIRALLPPSEAALRLARPQLAPLGVLPKQERSARLAELAAQIVAVEDRIRTLAAHPELAELSARFESLRAEHPELSVLLPTVRESLVESYLLRDAAFKEGQIAMDPLSFARDTAWPESDEVDEERVWRMATTDWDLEIETPWDDLRDRVQAAVDTARRDLVKSLRQELGGARAAPRAS